MPERPEQLPIPELSPEQIRASRDFFMAGDGTYGRHFERMYSTEGGDFQWVALQSDLGQSLYIERPHPMREIDSYIDIALWIPTHKSGYRCVAHTKDGAVKEYEPQMSKLGSGDDVAESIENARRNLSFELQQVVQPLEAEKIDGYTALIRSASEGTHSNLQADWQV